MSNFKKFVGVQKSNLAEDLAQLATALANIGNRLADMLADGKVTASEAFGLLLAREDVQIVLYKFKPVVKQWKAISPEQKEAAISEFAALLKISNYDAEIKVDAAITNGGKIYASLEKIYASVLAIHKAFSTHHEPPVATPPHDMDTSYSMPGKKRK